ncbi:LOW QUALITY PROTEIN: cyclin-dependent kinase inhibitor 1 [Paralichthys olivaceus]|uniref:LOW QUALITY PROTEIN: cyclin-dependent kinase inhibitor 1 n=1 Tax=Paralichthys olivaceus TaxID=8255 RepID=UPI00097DAF69|nr:PREDICTED: LOW QUALITY PROTEIN: cyclin-dependent kinase inhibitor 1-like [Paralichthys olivaceus]
MCRIMAAHKCILSSTVKGSARRNLFGALDREQLQVDYQAALRKDLEEASRRWGFDFMSNKPLESSDFQWKAIPGTKVPMLYRSCHQRQKKRPREQGQPLQNDKENVPSLPNRCALNLKNFEKSPEKIEKAGAKRKQTNLTDFYQTKRRVVWMPHKSGE